MSSSHDYPENNPSIVSLEKVVCVSGARQPVFCGVQEAHAPNWAPGGENLRGTFVWKAPVGCPVLVSALEDVKAFTSYTVYCVRCEGCRDGNYGDINAY